MSWESSTSPAFFFPPPVLRCPHGVGPFFALPARVQSNAVRYPVSHITPGEINMSESKTFADLGLSAATTAAINKKGFEEPTAIQAMTIPVMLEDRTDIIAQAQTGTGKTAAFGLPLIELLDLDSREVQALTRK